MPALTNPRQERFAQEIAKGTGTGEAYEAAGFRPNPGNARRLRGDEAVAKRIEALLERRSHIEEQATKVAIEKLAITKERVLQELAKIGFANMQDYMSAGPDGDPFLDFSALSRDQAAALAEVTVEDFRDGRGKEGRDVRRIKFKLHDKKGALVDIGRELGMFVNRSEVGAPGDFTGLSEDERESVGDAIRRELAGRAGGAGAGATAKPH